MPVGWFYKVRKRPHHSVCELQNRIHNAYRDTKKIGARPDSKSQHRKPSDELQAIAVRSSCTVMLLISVALVDLQQLSDFVVE